MSAKRNTKRAKSALPIDETSGSPPTESAMPATSDQEYQPPTSASRKSDKKPRKRKASAVSTTASVPDDSGVKFEDLPEPERVKRWLLETYEFYSGGGTEDTEGMLQAYADKLAGKADMSTVNIRWLLEGIEVFGHSKDVGTVRIGDKCIVAGIRKKKLIDSIDISKPLDNFLLRKDVLEALRLRIIDLEHQLDEERKSNNTGNLAPIFKPSHPVASRTSNAASAPVASTSGGAGPALTSKEQDKKVKLRLKQLFDRLKKECKADSIKFQGSAKTIKWDEVLDQAEFDGLFKGKGTLIQPTPQNKPTSSITIISFAPTEIFGAEFKPDQLKGFAWSVGGRPAIKFGGSFGFGFGGEAVVLSRRVRSWGVQGAVIDAILTIRTLKFTVQTQAPGDMGDPDSDGYDEYDDY